MKSLEFYQYFGSLSNRAMMLGTTHTSSKGRIKPVVSKYMEEVTKVLELINSKKDKTDPFGPKELNELVTSITNLRVALKNAKKTISKDDYEKNSELIATIEQVVALMDVTSGKPLNEVIDNTEVNSVSTKADPSKVSGQSSSRSLITVQFGNNKKENVDGFFTPEHKIFDENMASEVDFMFKKAIADHPDDRDIKNFYNRLKLTPHGMHTLFQCMNHESKKKYEPWLRCYYNEYTLDHYGLMGNIDNIDSFEDRKKGLANFLKDIRSHYENRYRELTANCYQYSDWSGVGVNAIAGSSKTARNVAVSNMANILGIPDLVAKSVPITVKVNGKNQKGVFMKQAKGIDAPDTPKLYKTDFMLCNADSISGDMLKQLADLQVLDFVCQNVDRHASNLLYTVDNNGKITGIQGIDNDLSFGTLKFKNALTTNFGNALNDITVISESMANRINTLQPETFIASLSGLGLKKEEIQSAWDRVLTLRKHIEKNRNDGNVTPRKIKVVKDNEWRKLDLVTLATTRQYANSTNQSLRRMSNLFDRVMGLLGECLREKRRHYGGKSDKYRKAKKAGFKNMNEIIPAEDIANPGFTKTEEFRAASFKGIEDIRANLSASEKVMKNASGEIANDETFKAMMKEIESANSVDYSLLQNETGSLAETHIDREERLFNQQKLRNTFREHLFSVIYTTRAFLDKFSKRAGNPAVREQYENALKLYKNTVQSEEVFQNASIHQQEEELNIVQLELQDEQRRFNDIVQTIVQKLSEKLEGISPEEIEKSIYDGPALKKMMDDDDLWLTQGKKDYINTYSLMAANEPDDLLNAYCQHVFSANPDGIGNDRISQEILKNPEKYGVVKEVIGKHGLLVVEDEIKNDENLIGSTDTYNSIVGPLNALVGSAATKCCINSYYGQDRDIELLAKYCYYRGLKDELEELGKQTLSDETVDQLEALKAKMFDKAAIDKFVRTQPIANCVHDDCYDRQLKEEDLNTIYSKYEELPKDDVKLEKAEVLLCKDDPKFQNLMKEIRDNINTKVNDIENDRNNQKSISKNKVANIIVQYEKLEALEKLADRKCTNRLYKKVEQIVDDSNIKEKVDQRVKEIVNSPAFKAAQEIGTSNTRHFDHEVMNSIRRMFNEGSNPATEQESNAEAQKEGPKMHS